MAAVYDGFNKKIFDPVNTGLKLQIDFDILFLNIMAFCIAGKNQGQSTVACDVTCSSETVLQSKDGQHQSGTGITELQNARDDSERCHNGSSRYTWSADGKNTEQYAEKNDSSRCRYCAVEDL